MFAQLVESSAHAPGGARRLWSLIVAAAVHAAALALLAIWSVLMYEAEPQMRATLVVSPSLAPTTTEKAAYAPRAASTTGSVSSARAARDRASPVAPQRVPEGTAVRGSGLPPFGPTGHAGEINGPPISGSALPLGAVGSSFREGRSLVEWIEPPPPLPSPSPAKPQPTRAASLGVIYGRALGLTAKYPEIARRLRIAGTVEVEILVDEKGHVVSARAINGHPLLRAAAIEAARSARFTPTLVAGQPVQARGVIVFRFVLD